MGLNTANKDNLFGLLEQQEKLTREIRDRAERLDTTTLQREIDKGLATIQALEKKLEDNRQRIERIQEERERYRLSVKELLIRERRRHFDFEMNRLFELIGPNKLAGQQAISNLETDIAKSYKQSTAEIRKNEKIFHETTLKNLDSYHQNILKTVENFKKEEQRIFNAQQEHINQTVDEFNQMEIPEEAIEKTYFDKKRETNLGVKLFSYIGIIFIFLAVITAGIYSIKFMNDILKMILLYILPTGFLIAGDYLYSKKNKKIFASGCIGGAIGLYYIATIISYFFLSMPQIAALLSLVIITIISISLSVRYKSRLMANIALIGGYLPLYSYLQIIGFSAMPELIVGYTYIGVLTGLMYFLTRKFQWYELLLASSILVFPWVFIFSASPASNTWMNHLIVFVYFMFFSAIQLVQEKGDTREELTPVNFSTFMIGFSTFLFYTLSQMTVTHSITNIVTFAIQITLFGVIFYLLRKQNFERKRLQVIMQVLLYAWVTYISIFYIPLLVLHNARYVLAGMIVNLIAYSEIGQKRKDARMLFTATSFYFIAMITYVGLTFTIEFSYIINMAMIALTLYISHMFRKTRDLLEMNYQETVKTMDALLPVIIFFHLNALLGYNLLKLMQSPFGEENLDTYFMVLISLIASMIFYLVVDLIPEIKKTKLPTIGLGICVVLVMIQNFAPLRLFADMELFSLRIALFVVANIMITAIVLQYIQKNIPKTTIYAEKVTLFIFAFLLMNGSVITYVNVSYAYLNIIMDIIYALSAFGLISIGFRKDQQLSRRIGLYAILVVIAKLMLFDIPMVSLFWRMVSFFIFGVISLVISYLYQNALSKLIAEDELEEEAM